MEETRVKLTAKQRDLIEKIGAAYERAGLASVSAKILALLLVAENPDLSFDQLQCTLGISKSAASNSINLLLSTGKIEQITKLGERKRFFRNRISHWKEDIKMTHDQIGHFVELLRAALKQRPGDTTEFNQTLKELIDFIEFLQRELPILYKKWEAGKK